MPPGAPTPDPESIPEESAENSGYRICLDVHADGTFGVKKAPLEAKPEGPMEAGGEPMVAEDTETYPTIEAALKGVLSIFKQNPLGETEQSAFDRSVGKPEPMMKPMKPGY